METDKLQWEQIRAASAIIHHRGSSRVWITAVLTFAHTKMFFINGVKLTSQ
jgi:hypothetical protein